MDPPHRGDRLFDCSASAGNRDLVREPFAAARRWLADRDVQLATLDTLADLERCDLVVFHVRDRAVLDRCLGRGIVERTAYLAWEPPAVTSWHTPDGLRRLSGWFARILTWDTSLVDGDAFLELRYPHAVGEVEPSPLAFDERGLLVNLSGDKSSRHPQELYGTRREVIRHFEATEPTFELWGPGWNPSEHPRWKGVAPSKREVYHRFRFALCLENLDGAPGYLTEKLFDCLKWGIVPVYRGDPQVASLLPPEAWVDHQAFQDPALLHAHLAEWTSSRHAKALEAGRAFLESDRSRPWSGESFGKALLECLDLSTSRPRRPSPGLWDRVAMRAAWWRRSARGDLR